MSEPDASAPPHGSILRKFRTRRVKPRFIWLSLLTLVLAIVTWFGFTLTSLVSRMTGSSDTKSPVLRFIGQQIDPNALAGEGDGRINILLIGIGGAGHPGGTLADTIIVASVDPQNKKVALLSIPRDLRVPIPGDGTDKINAAHSFGESQKSGDGPNVLKETVSKVIDLPIHYYIRVDFQGFVRLINTVGGVTVDVPKAVNDPLFPDEKLEGYSPFYIGAGVHQLDGATALKYARSRETTSDFDRAARQQLILMAFRDKVLSLNVLANPKKLTDIVNILGSHIHTDMSLKDIERLFTLVKDVKTDRIVTKVLDTSADEPLMSINDGGYYLVTKTGDFSEIQRIAHELFTDPYLTHEQAKIEIQNATGLVGRAHELELDLKSLGYTIVSIQTAPEQPHTTLYDYSGGKAPFSVRFLQERLGAIVQSVARPDDATGIDLRLIIGTDYQPKQLKS